MTVTPSKYQLIENQYSKDADASKLDSGAFQSQTKAKTIILTLSHFIAQPFEKPL